MLVSVIIPIYNAAKYLPACLNCVVNQTWPDLQIILVNDGSTDDSGSICDQYAEIDKRIEVIHQNNEGLSVSRNVGTDHTRGEYLLYLDADDEWGSLDFVEKLVNQAKQHHPDVILFEIRDFRDEKEHTTPIGIYDNEVLNGSPSEVMVRLMRAHHYSMSACQKFIRKDVLTNNNIRFTPMLLGEDMDWIMQFWPCVKSVEGNTEIHYRYRTNGDGITHNYELKNANDFCWIIEKWQKYWEESNDPNKYAYLGYLAFLYVTLVYKYFYLNSHNRKIIKKRILALSNILQYSKTKKSNRLKIVKLFLGRYSMLYIFGGIQYLRRHNS